MKAFAQGFAAVALVVAMLIYTIAGTREAVLTWLAISATASLLAIAHKRNNQ